MRGKKLVLFILAFGLVPLLVFSATRIFRPIAPKDAFNYVGQSRKVGFTVARTQLVESKGIYVYPLEASDFYVFLPTRTLSHFPQHPELFYAGKKLYVTAQIKQEGPRYFMTLESKNQIDVQR